MSSSPWLLFLADSKSDDIHGPMQGGRDKDDGNESKERVAGEEPRDRPTWNREVQEQRADDEIVPVEDRGLRAAGLVHPPLQECAREIAQERAEGEDRGGPEGHAVRSERPSGTQPEDVERHREEESQGHSGQRPADEAPPRLPVAEEPLAIAERPAEVDWRAAPKDDRHRVRDVGGEEEPEGLRDRHKVHRGRVRSFPGYS